MRLDLPDSNVVQVLLYFSLKIISYPEMIEKVHLQNKIYFGISFGTYTYFRVRYRIFCTQCLTILLKKIVLKACFYFAQINRCAVEAWKSFRMEVCMKWYSGVCFWQTCTTCFSSFKGIPQPLHNTHISS